MDIGKRIQSRRKELGMTQEQLATAVYVSPQAVSQWENNRSLPDICNIGLIAATLGIRKEDLISEEEKTKPSWVVRDQIFSENNMYRKLKEFAENESLTEMKKALDYAWEKHADQKRKTSVISGEQVPYIVHPLMMACQAHAMGIHDDTVLAVTLLHDVCEDCGVASEELPFPNEIKEAVALLTKPDSYTQKDQGSYYKGIAGNSSAAIVKALDRCNNVSTMMLGFSIEKIIEYVDETQDYVYPLLDHIKKHYPQYYDAVFVLKYQLVSTIETAKAAIIRI